MSLLATQLKSILSTFFFHVCRRFWFRFRLWFRLYIRIRIPICWGHQAPVPNPQYPVPISVTSLSKINAFRIAAGARNLNVFFLFFEAVVPLVVVIVAVLPCFRCFFVIYDFITALLWRFRVPQVVGLDKIYRRRWRCCHQFKSQA